MYLSVLASFASFYASSLESDLDLGEQVSQKFALIEQMAVENHKTVEIVAITPFSLPSSGGRLISLPGAAVLVTYELKEITP